MTAHHAVLLTNVIGSESVQGEPPTAVPSAHPAIGHLRDGLNALARRPAVEIYHDAVHWLRMAQDAYIHGLLTLEQRAVAEHLYYATCQAIRPLLRETALNQRRIIDELDEKLADKVFCNFSVFQSLPDVWAIDQVFPIMPLGRLDEPPTRRGVLSDITCDSDGRIDRYVEGQGVESTLPLHEIAPGEDYLLGIFLVGAYQEVLGDIHNLFGDTHTVNIEIDENGGYRIEAPRRGEDVAAVLRHVHIDDRELLAIYRRRVTEAGLDEAVARDCLEALEEGLRGYTYLED